MNGIGDPPDPDEKLTKEARKAPEGDLRIFEQLILRHQGRVAANCRYITLDPNSAEDLAQDVFVKAFFGLRDFDGTSSFAAWLQRIKISHCLNYLNEQAGLSYVGIDEPDVDEFEELQVPLTPEKLVGAISAKQLISAVLDSMSRNLRIPLVLCDMDELSYEEIARYMGISLSATKMRIKRARDEFRERYQKLLTAGTPMRAK
jgi:RNA polymerase sigma-70 factor (ECF subfamily)